MTLALDDLKAHCNVTGDADDAVLTRKLAAATAFVERQLGFSVDDAIEFPNGTPADLEEAILQTAAHFYETREATVIGGGALILPLGVPDIIREYRRYSFGEADDDR